MWEESACGKRGGVGVGEGVGKEGVQGRGGTGGRRVCRGKGRGMQVGVCEDMSMHPRAPHNFMGSSSQNVIKVTNYSMVTATCIKGIPITVWRK